MTDLLTAILIFITAYYAWQTYRTTKIMEDANEANNRPVVSVSIINDRPEGVSFVDLVIRNSGNGLAKSVVFSVTGDELEVENIGERKRTIKDIGVLQSGIKTLAPAEVRRTWLLSTIGRVDEVLSKEIKVAVAYKNTDFSKTYNDEFLLDFASLTRIQLGHDPVDHIDREIEKIRKAIENIGREVGKK